MCVWWWWEGKEVAEKGRANKAPDVFIFCRGEERYVYKAQHYTNDQTRRKKLDNRSNGRKDFIYCKGGNYASTRDGYRLHSAVT